MRKGIINIESTNNAAMLLQECAAWMELLEYLKEESYFLKTRLSEMLDHKTEKEFLDEAEYFQSLFILKDEYIIEIAKDLKAHEQKIRNSIFSASFTEDKFSKQHQRLRNEISFLEKDFLSMKNDFYRGFFKVV